MEHALQSGLIRQRREPPQVFVAPCDAQPAAPPRAWGTAAPQETIIMKEDA